MKINWFPGHMHKALKDISEQLKKVDVVTYILDARIPLASINPSLNEITQNKPVLYVFNKIDMADEKKIKALLPQFKSKTSDFGKSTLVNNLCKKAKAITGNKAGVTKHGLWLPIGGGIEVYDTPGTLYPNIENQETAKKLAFVGSVRDEVFDFVDLANDLLNILLEQYPENVKKRYENKTTLEEIATLRKFVINGGELDLERTAKSVVDDFRKGRLGKITLD